MIVQHVNVFVEFGVESEHDVDKLKTRCDASARVTQPGVQNICCDLRAIFVGESRWIDPLAELSALLHEFEEVIGQGQRHVFPVFGVNGRHLVIAIVPGRRARV